MTKRLNSKHKIDRRLKVNLWGRPKSPFNTRAYGPGQHGQTRTSKPSNYGIQLNAKQKLKFVRIPKFEEVPYPIDMEPNLVVEYYSR